MRTMNGRIDVKKKTATFSGRSFLFFLSEKKKEIGNLLAHLKLRKRRIVQSDDFIL